MKKYFLILLTILAVVFVFIGCAETTTSQPASTTSSQAATSKPAEVRVLKGLVNDPRSNRGTWDRIDAFVEAVNTRLEGEVRLEPNGPEVVPIMEMADAVRSGAMDMVIYAPRGMASALMPCCMSGEYSEYTAAEERQSGAFEVWDEVYGKYLNSKYLGQWDNGPHMQYFLWTNKPIDKVEDVKGMKIRVFGVFDSVAKSWGANPIMMALTEIYTAMQRGVVDGYITTKSVVAYNRLFEVTEYMIEPGFFRATSTTFVNLDVWNSLSKKAQDVLIEETINQEVLGIKWLEDMCAEAVVTNTAGGVEIHQMPQAEADRMIGMASEAGWAYVLEKDTSDYTEKFRELLTKQ